MKDLENLIGMTATKITEKHIKDGLYARRLNVNLAFLIHDCLSLMDRGFIFSLIKCYLKKVCVGGGWECGVGVWWRCVGCVECEV